MPIERRPAKPLPQDYKPPSSNPYKVKDGDSLVTIARTRGLDPWKLIHFNFQTTIPAEVNWYLRHRVGCVKPTSDNRNWMFTRSARPGIIYVPRKVIQLPPIEVTAQPPKKRASRQLPSRPDKTWVGIAKAHSGDFFVIGAHDLTGKIYNLGGDEKSKKNAWININGWKFGLGLGGSVGAVLVIAYGYETANEMNGVTDDVDFDIALITKLSDYLKGLKGIGTVVKNMEEYKKISYAAQNVIKNRGVGKPGVFTLPIPGAGVGAHLWLGYKFGDVKVFSQGTGVP